MGHIILLIRDLRASEETFSPVVHIHSSLIYYVRSRGQCSVLEDSVKSPTQTCLCFCVLCSAVDGQRLLPPPMGQPQGTLQIRTGFLGRDPPGAGSPREHTASPGSVMTELIFWSPSFACTEKILWIFFLFFFFISNTYHPTKKYSQTNCWLGEFFMKDFIFAWYTVQVNCCV